MSIKDNNIKVLKEFRPELYAKLLGHKGESKYEIQFSKEKGKHPNLLHKQKKEFFYDQKDPLQGVAQKLQNKQIRVPELSVFLGFGLGYELLVFLQKLGVPKFNAIVIEKDPEILLAALHVIDLRNIFKDQNIHIIVDTPINTLFPMFYTILESGNNLAYVKSLNVIENDVSYLENKDYYLQAFAQLREGVRQVLKKFGNDPWDSLIGIDNTFANIGEIIKNPGVNDLFDKFKGVPGIVVATGPSLNKNIDLLKGLGNKAVICSADASFKIMLEKGLKPHMVTSLERKMPTVRFYEGLSEEDVEGVYFAGSPVVRPEVYGTYQGKRIIVYRNFATFNWIDIDKGMLDIGPSSANMSYKILESLGCDPIILIGQDLAFGDDATTHAKGAAYGEKEKKYYDAKRLVKVPGNYKAEVETTDVWHQFLKHYEKDISRHGGTVINATEGGAKIQGAELMTFSEAIEKYVQNEHDILEQIDINLNPPKSEKMQGDLKKTVHKVNEAIEYCQYVIKEFLYAYQCSDTFMEDIAKPYQAGEAVDAERAEKLFNEISSRMSIMGESQFHLILMHYVQSYHIKAVVEINGLRASEPITAGLHTKIILCMKDMYAVMIKLIEKMLELFGLLKQNLISFEASGIAQKNT